MDPKTHTCMNVICVSFAQIKIIPSAFTVSMKQTLQQALSTVSPDWCAPESIQGRTVLPFPLFKANRTGNNGYSLRAWRPTGLKLLCAGSMAAASGWIGRGRRIGEDSDGRRSDNILAPVRPDVLDKDCIAAAVS